MGAFFFAQPIYATKRQRDARAAAILLRCDYMGRLGRWTGAGRDQCLAAAGEYSGGNTRRVSAAPTKSSELPAELTAVLHCQLFATQVV